MRTSQIYSLFVIKLKIINNIIYWKWNWIEKVHLLY